MSAHYGDDGTPSSPAVFDPEFLTVKALLPRLEALSDEELHDTLRREVSGRNRSSVVRRINHLLLARNPGPTTTSDREDTLPPPVTQVPRPSSALDQTVVRFCSDCGGRVGVRAVFCRECGAAIGISGGPALPSTNHQLQRSASHSRTNGLAIASLVLGIVWLGGIGSLSALIFGRTAKGQIGKSGEAGEGMATAGIVLGIVGLALGVYIFGTMYLANSAADKFTEVGNCIEYGIGC